MTGELRNVSNIALTTSALFLVVVAVALNSPVLFSMATAMLALLGVCRFQAWMAVRGLRFRRRPLPTVRVGDTVQVEIEVTSTARYNRPLLMVRDRIPDSLLASEISPSLPIAPAPGQTVVTQYRLTPLRRGVFRWSVIEVTGSDPLGLAKKTVLYRVDAEPLTVLPAPLPFSLVLPSSAGWGGGEADHGPSRGPGIDPRGIREYQVGDSLRHVHWRSSARTGRLLVKEFEVGLYSRACVFVQRSPGTAGAVGRHSPLDFLCGHAAYLAEAFLGQGLSVSLPGLDSSTGTTKPQTRLLEILRELAALVPEEEPFGAQVARSLSMVSPGSAIYLFLAEADQTLLEAIRQLRARNCSVHALVLPLPALGGSVVQPASTPEYLSSLRTVGADTELLPEPKRQ